MASLLTGATRAFVVHAALLVAGVKVLVAASHVASFVWRNFLRPGKDLKRTYGGWAVVTGCTDGIGKAFCEELAKKGIPLLLISRTEAKLKALASELKEKHGANYEVSYVVADFVNADDAAWARIASEVRAVDVGMLFNNVGMSYPHAEFLHNLDATLVDDLIRVNVECTTKMTRIVLPGMVQRKSGAIVNVGSGAATVLPSDPLYAVYAGAKGYVDQFSRTLYSEYRRDGIDVQLQAPLFVVSKMSKIRRSSLTVPTPRAYARAGLRTVGYEPRVSPFWAHAAMWAIVASLPEWFMDNVRYGQSMSIRKRALKKKAAAKAKET